MTTSAAYNFVPEWSLGDRLRKARELCGHTQGDMAELLGISQRAISNYEKAGDPVQPGRAPKAQTLMAWAMATGVAVHWLQTGEAPPSDGDGGASGVRPKGLEPLTSCSGEDQAVTCIDEYRDRRWVSSPVEAVPAVARMVG